VERVAAVARASRRLSRSRWQSISMTAARMISKNTSAVDLNVDGLGDALEFRPGAGGLARCSSIQLVYSLLTNGVA
jgi:hypothetical protein